MAQKNITIDEALTLAKSYENKGDDNSAQELYLMILSSFPQNKEALKALKALDNKTKRGENLGLTQIQINELLTLYSKGNYNEASTNAKSLSLSHPKEPLLHNILGACYVGLGRLDDAIESYNKSLAINPDEAETYNNLGNAFNLANQTEKAIVSYKKALNLKPDFAEAHNNLGNVYKKIGQLNEALKRYEHALEIKPMFAEALNSMGSVFMAVGQQDKAIQYFKLALKSKPDIAEVYNNLGSALIELGQPDQAVKNYKRAIELKPNYAEAHNNLGLVFNDLGQQDSAIQHYKKALAIKPSYAEVHHHLSTLKKYRTGDIQIAQMENLLLNGDSNTSLCKHIYFALAKAYEDLGDYDKSFAHIQKGNDLCKTELNYNIKHDKKLFINIKQSFTNNKQLYNIFPNDEIPTINPIFIVGMPRSGTTLVEQILASHSKVHGAGELATMGELGYPIIANSLNQMPPKTNHKISHHQIEMLRNAYLEKLSSLNVAETYITDKMPLNFMWIGLILTAFPKAKIIHMKRDPRATCWSIYKHYFSTKGNAYAYDTKDLAEFYKYYLDIMLFWKKNFSDYIYDVNYELLTKNQEEESRKLLEFCNLDWEENCLNFHKVKRAVRTASAAQVRKKMYQGSSEAWKKYEKHLKPMLTMLESAIKGPN